MAGNEGSAIQLNDSAPKGTDANLISFPTDGLSAGGPPSIETLNNSIKDNLQPVAVMEGDKVLAGSLIGTAPSANMSTFSATGYQTYGLPGAPQELRGAPEDFAYPRVPVTPITPFALTETGYVMPTDTQDTPAIQFTGSLNGDVAASPQTSTVANPGDISAANATTTTPADTSAGGTSISDDAGTQTSTVANPSDTSAANTTTTTPADTSAGGTSTSDDAGAQTDNTVTPNGGGGCNGGGARRGGGMAGLAGFARLGLGIGLLSTLFRGGGLGMGSMGGMFGGLMAMSMLGRMFGGGMGGMGMGGMGMGGMGMGGMGMGGMNPFGMFGLLSMFRSRL